MDNIIDNIKTELLEQKTRTKTLLKYIARLEKQIKKPVQQKVNGFARPTNISESLANFIKVDPTTQISRTEVTKYIIKYIQTHKLQNPECKTQILPDDDLRTLLGPNIPNPLTYFNIQKCMNRHFIRTI
jgi:chromatin remodeling complex protein RSC6